MVIHYPDGAQAEMTEEATLADRHDAFSYSSNLSSPQVSRPEFNDRDAATDSTARHWITGKC